MSQPSRRGLLKKGLRRGLGSSACSVMATKTHQGLGPSTALQGFSTGPARRYEMAVRVASLGQAPGQSPKVLFKSASLHTARVKASSLVLVVEISL